MKISTKELKRVEVMILLEADKIKHIVCSAFSCVFPYRLQFLCQHSVLMF